VAEHRLSAGQPGARHGGRESLAEARTAACGDGHADAAPHGWRRSRGARGQGASDHQPAPLTSASARERQPTRRMTPSRRPNVPKADSASFRVAIIGLGEAGSGLHLPALARMPAAHVVGGCDRDGKARERVAARWRIPVFADPDMMLAETRADVVIIATPPA